MENPVSIVEDDNVKVCVEPSHLIVYPDIDPCMDQLVNVVVESKRDDDICGVVMVCLPRKVTCEYKDFLYEDFLSTDIRLGDKRRKIRLHGFKFNHTYDKRVYDMIPSVVGVDVIFAYDDGYLKVPMVMDINCGD